MVARMRDDSLHVPLHGAGNPGEMPVFRAAADLHDPLYGSAYRIRISARIGLREHLIYDVAGCEELVLGYEVLVALPGPSLLQGLLLAEEGASPEDHLAGVCIALLPLPGVGTGHKDVCGVLEGPCGLGVALLLKPCLLILPDLTDHLLVEVLHDMEVVVDDVQV